MDIKIKRIYEPATVADGYRILVDRLWPRGISKSFAAIDWWDKDIAPSTQLRKWFAHDPGRWDKFSDLYRHELEQNQSALNDFAAHVRGKNFITLLYAAKDEQHTHALVLQTFLKKNLFR